MTIKINDLPIEILSKIFTFLKVRHRKNAALVCTKWRNATRCPSFYRTLKLHDGLYLDEPPLSLFRCSYHPFSVIYFDSIEDFEDNNVAEFWKEVSESVRELIFSSCEGLNTDSLDMLLSHMKNVTKIKIIGKSSIEPIKLENNYKAIKSLDLSNTEIPDWYIESITPSFPELQELIIGSYTYDGWDSNEDYLRNIDPSPNMSSAFGEWVSRLSKLAPKVSLKYDYQIVLNAEKFLREILPIPNLEINSMKIEREGTSDSAFQKFIQTKGSQLKKLEVPDAKNMQTKDLELINTYCTNIVKLQLRFTEGKDLEVLEKLENLKKLQKFIISGPEDIHHEFKLTNKQKCFMNMQAMMCYNMKFCDDLKGLEFTFASFPFLTVLSLVDCTISTEALKIIFKICTKLEKLHFNCSDQISEEGLYGDSNNSLNSLTLLEVLDLNGCTNISNQTLSKFIWKELYSLGLRNVTNISVEGFTRLCKNCPTIEQLDLNGCTGINDDCVEVITKGLSNLKEIDLSGTSITEKALDHISNNCFKIKNVNISYEPPSDSKAAEKLLQKRILHFLSALAMNNISQRLYLD